MELFILNSPPLLCVVAEIRTNLIDGGQTNRYAQNGLRSGGVDNRMTRDDKALVRITGKPEVNFPIADDPLGVDGKR